MIKKVIYLGPKGSYTDAAKERFSVYFDKSVEFYSEKSINSIIRLLNDKKNSDFAAVVPIENSIEGVVRETLDNLASLADKGIKIVAETKLSIEHCLIGFATKKNIKTVSSHPQALAQCREYLFNNFGSSIIEKPVVSTSSAVSNLSCESLDSAAIASEFCAKLYNVPIIEKNINDELNNTTRFILLANKETHKSDVNKVSITFSTENKPGALNKILNILEKNSLNMSYIDSRPSRKELGEYIFFIDFEGHILDFKVSSAIKEIEQYVRKLVILSDGAEII